MATDIRVPTLGESVTEATVGQWFKKAGDPVTQDEPLVELETDKVTIEVPAPAAGTLSEIVVSDGETVEPGALLGSIAEGAAKPAAAPQEDKEDKPAEKPKEKPAEASPAPAAKGADMPPAPAARKIMEEKGIEAEDVEGTGKRGQILKEDVLKALESGTGKERESVPAAARPPSVPGRRGARGAG
jgi:2-oxoglutarate dehydrogenase E2 component (dihydrolipoamide succinyltransferase)